MPDTIPHYRRHSNVYSIPRRRGRISLFQRLPLPVTRLTQGDLFQNPVRRLLAALGVPAVRALPRLLDVLGPLAVPRTGANRPSGRRETALRRPGGTGRHDRGGVGTSGRGVFNNHKVVELAVFHSGEEYADFCTVQLHSAIATCELGAQARTVAQK